MTKLQNEISTDFDEDAPLLHMGLIAYIPCSSDEFKNGKISAKEKRVRKAAHELGYEDVAIISVVNGQQHRFAMWDAAKILKSAQDMTRNGLEVHLAIENCEAFVHRLNPAMRELLLNNSCLSSDLDEIFSALSRQEIEKEFRNLEPIEEENQIDALDTLQQASVKK